MLEVFDVVGLVSVATLFGSMAFFSCVVAPLTFVKLDAANAGRFVRSIFPWYYLVIAVFALAAAVSVAVLRPVTASVMVLIALGAIFARQLLMPQINHHRDRMVAGDAGAEPRFARLHRLSVWINGAQLVGAFAVLLHMAAS